MKLYKQSYNVFGGASERLGTIKTNTKHEPLGQNDKSVLALARKMYGSNVSCVELTATEEVGK